MSSYNFVFTSSHNWCKHLTWQNHCFLWKFFKHLVYIHDTLLNCKLPITIFLSGQVSNAIVVIKSYYMYLSNENTSSQTVRHNCYSQDRLQVDLTLTSVLVNDDMSIKQTCSLHAQYSSLTLSKNVGFPKVPFPFSELYWLYR